MADNKIQWKAVIEYNGTPEQYEEFSNVMNEILEKYPVQIYIPEWRVGQTKALLELPVQLFGN
jgi:hypothetical protein